MSELMPAAVEGAITSYLRDRAIEVAADVWASSAADEDSLTGDFFGQLRKRGARMKVNGDVFVWSVTYTKLRGRGPNAPEKKLGADGLFEVDVRHPATDSGMRKAIPFQAKKNWTSQDQSLVEQLKAMEHAVQTSAVVSYSADGFQAVDGKSALRSKGRPPRKGLLPVGEYLGKVVMCDSGRKGLYFDASRQLFVVDGAFVRMPVQHRLRVEVVSRAVGLRRP